MLENDQKKLAKTAWLARKPMSQGGLLKYVHGEEYHAFNPDVIQSLQAAVQTGDYKKWKIYTELVNGRPTAAIRDLFGINAAVNPIDIDEVEPIEAILKRFDSAGMSLGALSPEAHEALAGAQDRARDAVAVVPLRLEAFDLEQALGVAVKQLLALASM